ncbi:MAG: hypothetical protein NT047_16285 [Deltaproteobacteria bacterium]|nr:hypothetical protein [Deltaproteobacteria bacterium]
MQGIRIFRDFKRFPLFRLARPIIMALFVLVYAAPSPAAERIAVFPAAPYDAYIIYESLAVFWIAIIGLIVIIRMKLREIERIQEMGEDREDNDAPLLE